MHEELVEFDGTSIPKDYVSCPRCGRLYGHHNTKVCKKCEECSFCHKRNTCDNHDFMNAKDFIRQDMKNW